MALNLGMMDCRTGMTHTMNGHGGIIVTTRGREAETRPLKDGTGSRIRGPGTPWKTLKGVSAKGALRRVRQLLAA